MEKSKSELMSKVRSNLGSPSETELSDAQLIESIDSAVREYSRYKPKTVYAEFETEANIAEIPIAAVIPGSTTLHIVDCFYDPTGVFFDSDLYYTLPGTPTLTSLSGLSLFHNPSLVVQYQQKLEAFKSHFGGDWDFYDGTLRLLPPPSTSGMKVGVIASCARVLADVPNIDEDTLLLWAEAQTGKILAQKRAQITGISMEGSNISLGAGAMTLKLAEAKEESFKKKLGGPLGAFSIG